ncbi:hypothetical protein BpHYR1_052170 [Brachionus plicatilis]|uniref:Uncharacterized protein n=1 Tax=Brachionus plicatilis TaxID=10195 RepID=A0A3M7R4E8_BRAPC|nr:hypothetical protein BpHYR1_052170 [Brachionus plicatilis]
MKTLANPLTKESITFLVKEYFIDISLYEVDHSNQTLPNNLSVSTEYNDYCWFNFYFQSALK